MIGAAVQLQESIADLAIDAAQGRQSWSAAGILRAHLEAGHIGEVVVIHLGNNYIFTPQQVDEIMQVLAKVRASSSLMSRSRGPGKRRRMRHWPPRPASTPTP